MSHGNFENIKVLEKNKITSAGISKSQENLATPIKSEPINLKELNIENLEFWPKIINKLREDKKMLLATNLMNTIATLINDMTVGIIFQNGLTPFVKSVMERPENMQELIRLISVECGKEMRIKLLDSQDEILRKKAKEKEEDNLIKDLEIPINIIEE